MKTEKVLSNIVVALAISSFTPIFALAQVQPPAPSTQNQAVVIPQSSAITITFPIAVTFNASRKQSLTTAAYLARPLLDSNGNVVAPANSPINIQLQPTKGGAQIKAEALVVDGLVTPIQALGPLIPDRTVVTDSNVHNAQANQGLYGSVAGTMFNVLFSAVGGANRLLGDQANNLTNIGNSLGSGLVTMSGLSSPRKTRQVDIPPGSVYILTLQTAVTLPPKVVHSTSPTQTPAVAPVAMTTPPAQSQPSTALDKLGSPTKTMAVIASGIIYVNSVTGVDSAGERGKTEATAYRTITYALSQASAGTVIQLATGSYTEKTGEVFPLALKPGVTLRGDAFTKGQNTVITGGGRYISPTFARQDVTVQASDDSTITGITITNPNTRGTAVWIESTNPTIENNTFTASNREGIFVTGTAVPKIEANVFIKNGGNGISLVRSAQGVIRNNLFEDTGFGIAIGGNASPLVTENKFIHNQDGMFISDDARPMLRHNMISNNKRDGVVIAACSQAQPDLGTTGNDGGNIFGENGQYDIHNGGAKSLVAIGNQLDPNRVAEAKQQCL